MSLQNLFPYNPTITGLKDVYIKKDYGFYINLPCIKCPDQVVMTGRTYVLIDAVNGTVNASSVELLDAFYFQEHLYFLLRDTESQIIRLVHMFEDINEYHCTWRLLDYQYLKEKAEKR